MVTWFVLLSWFAGVGVVLGQDGCPDEGLGQIREVRFQIADDIDRLVIKNPWGSVTVREESSQGSVLELKVLLTNDLDYTSVTNGTVLETTFASTTTTKTSTMTSSSTTTMTTTTTTFVVFVDAAAQKSIGSFGMVAAFGLAHALQSADSRFTAMATMALACGAKVAYGDIINCPLQSDVSVSIPRSSEVTFQQVSSTGGEMVFQRIQLPTAYQYKYSQNWKQYVQGPSPSGWHDEFSVHFTINHVSPPPTDSDHRGYIYQTFHGSWTWGSVHLVMWRDVFQMCIRGNVGLASDCPPLDTSRPFVSGKTYDIVLTYSKITKTQELWVNGEYAGGDKWTVAQAVRIDGSVLGNYVGRFYHGDIYNFRAYDGIVPPFVMPPTQNTWSLETSNGVILPPVWCYGPTGRWDEVSFTFQMDVASSHKHTLDAILLWTRFRFGKEDAIWVRLNKGYCVEVCIFNPGQDCKAVTQSLEEGQAYDIAVTYSNIKKTAAGYVDGKLQSAVPFSTTGPVLLDGLRIEGSWNNVTNLRVSKSFIDGPTHDTGSG